MGDLHLDETRASKLFLEQVRIVWRCGLDLTGFRCCPVVVVNLCFLGRGGGDVLTHIGSP
jgi:hypothetical protein